MACGFLVLDKPAGMTSRRAVDHVKRLVRPDKTGHAGTLDPLATGVLVVAVGRATRLMACVQAGPKTYRATFLLGRRSETDDTEISVEVLEATPDLADSDIATALEEFVGEIQQVPPAYSAVKVAGRRAYQLARSGQDVELTARTVRVDSIRILGWSSPELDVEIVCGSGTYIRSIGRDLGSRLGCGAVMSGLVRTRVGPFLLDEATPVESLDPEIVFGQMVSPLVAVADLPRQIATPAQLEEIFHGRRVAWSGAIPGDGARVVLVDSESQLAAIGDYVTDTAQFAPRHVFLDDSSLPEK